MMASLARFFRLIFFLIKNSYVVRLRFCAELYAVGGILSTGQLSCYSTTRIDPTPNNQDSDAKNS